MSDSLSACVEVTAALGTPATPRAMGFVPRQLQCGMADRARHHHGQPGGGAQKGPWIAGRGRHRLGRNWQRRAKVRRGLISSPVRSTWLGGFSWPVWLVWLACGSLACKSDAGVGGPQRATALGHPLPGAQSFPAEVQDRLAAAWARRDRTEKPRSRHLLLDGSPAYTNRLALESSPYLRQHAHNPVNFFPWGNEAFALAAQLGRPVLLSVGYSTCHWCHVMEEESFDDEEIARALNEGYIAIKVDREERPDIDAVYMTAVQALTGSGGWPMTVWLTPDRKPFYGGTYFPARDGDRGARIGFLTMLKRLRESYDKDRGQVAEAAALLSRKVQAESGALQKRGVMMTPPRRRNSGAPGWPGRVHPSDRRRALPADAVGAPHEAPARTCRWT